jgi:integrase
MGFMFSRCRKLTTYPPFGQFSVSTMKDITPIDDHGSIRLRFSCNGQRYNFSPVPGGHYGTKRDLKTATAKATQIQNDIIAGNFDTTLDRYRITPKPAAKKPPQTDYFDIWDEWVRSLELSPDTQADHYGSIRKMIVKHCPKPSETQWLSNAKLAVSTFNKRRNYLRRCFDWAVKQHHLTDNPWDTVKPRRVEKEHVVPFSVIELQNLLAGFEAMAKHYTPFVKFLMLTGARMSEAIGLRWGVVNFERGEITISESLSIDRTKNGYQRKRKATKTGSIRVLPMNARLRKLLESLTRGGVNDLVFHSARGYQISDCNFRQVWRKVLYSKGILYRRPHILRHTLLSHAVEQGMPFTAVAYLAGHSSAKMIVSTYGHMINRPDLPDLDL